jgi:predicted metal-dependent peptidase
MAFKKRPHPKANPSGPLHGCKDAREAVGLARIRLLKRFPLFGVPACRLKLVKTHKVDTTAVDAKGHLYYNPDWIDGMTVKDLECEIAHEVGHVITNCFTRFPKLADPGIWNLANDQIIDNLIIAPTGIEPSPVMKKMSLTPEVTAAAQKDKVTEVRYRNLLNEAKQQTNCPACKKAIEALQKGPEGLDKDKGQGGQGEQKAEGQGDGQGGEGSPGQDGSESGGSGGCSGHGHGDGGNAQGNGNGTQGEPQHTCGNGRGCISGSLSSFQNLPPDQQAKATNQWKQAVLKGAQLQKQKSKGNLPGMLEDWMAELVKPQVTWKDHIRACVHRTCNKANWSYRRPSRRGQALGLTLPGRDIELSGVVVAIDTSGSISPKELTQFVGEIMGIMKECHINKVTVIMHDCVVYHVGVYDSKSIRSLKVQTGGTSHVPVFDYIYDDMKAKDKPKVLICFTDMMTEHHPKTPDFPVLWCCFEEYENYGKDIPYGKMVTIPSRSGWGE